MAQATDTLEAQVDFNELDEDGNVVAALEHFNSSRRPRIGEQVFLGDHEGNTCWGAIVRTAAGVAHLRLDPGTWRHSAIEASTSLTASSVTLVEPESYSPDPERADLTPA